MTELLAVISAAGAVAGVLLQAVALLRTPAPAKPPARRRPM